MVQFLDDAPRHIFFTGKGGVGKTSVACATAVELTRRGKRVLIISTDPASNVGHVFGQTIGNRMTPIDAVPGLDALEIDPEQAAEAYRNRIIDPVRAILPPSEIATITEQLSGSCTVEIASFNEFTNLLADPSRTATPFASSSYPATGPPTSMPAGAMPPAWARCLVWTRAKTPTELQSRPSRTPMSPASFSWHGPSRRACTK